MGNGDAEGDGGKIKTNIEGMNKTVQGPFRFVEGFGRHVNYIVTGIKNHPFITAAVLFSAAAVAALLTAGVGGPLLVGGAAGAGVAHEMGRNDLAASASAAAAPPPSAAHREVHPSPVGDAHGFAAP